MKFAEHQTTLESNLDAPVGAFSIKMSAHAFRTLSKTIYSDPIKAAIRELCCNAIDAHVMGGKADVPITVNLPTILKPSFSVRDEGIGLSFNDVEKLYTTYFDSTKTQSNEAVGGFGIGSKSPFAYTDQFTVTARWNGAKRTYVCFMSDGKHTPEGTPSIQQMGTDSDASEPNGLTVEFPVKPGDTQRFVSKYFEVEKWFDVKPNINVGRAPEITRTPLLARNNWEVFSASGHSNILAVQGGVAYPVNFQDFECDPDIKREFKEYYTVIKFPIGSVSPAPSREQLSYDKHTVANINKVLEDVRREATKDYDKAFDDVKSEYEAVSKYLDLQNKPFFSIIKPVFNGKPINTRVAIKFDDILKIDGVNIRYISGYELNCENASGKFRELPSSMVDKEHYSYKKDGTLVNPGNEHFVWFPHFRAKQGRKLPIWWSEYRSQHKLSSYGHTIYEITCDENTLKKVIPLLKGFPVQTKFADDSVVKDKSPKAIVKPYKLNGYYTNYDSIKSYVYKVDVDLNTNGYYAKTDMWDMSNAELICRAAKANLITRDEFCVVPRSMWEQFDTNDKWTPIENLIEERWSKVDKSEFVKIQRNRIRTSKYKSLADNVFVGKLFDLSGTSLDKFKELKAIRLGLELYRSNKLDVTKWQFLIDFAVFKGYTFPAMERHNSKYADRLYARFLSRFPMLSAVTKGFAAYGGPRITNEIVQDCLDYIKFKS